MQRKRRRDALASALWEWRVVLAVAAALGGGVMLGASIDGAYRTSSRGATAGGSAMTSDVSRLCEPATISLAAPCRPCICPTVSAGPPASLRSDVVGSNDGLLLESVFRHDPLLRPEPAVPDNASVCMVVRTFKEHRNKLVVMLASVLLWDHPGLRIILIDTGTKEPFSDLADVASMTSRLAGRPDAVTLSRWRSNSSRAVFPQLDAAVEDHGYVATDLALEDILEARRLAREAGVPTDSLPCDSLIVTNGDNLYGYQYLAATQEAVRGGAMMVNTHWVSHYEMKKEWILNWGEVRTRICGF